MSECSKCKKGFEETELIWVKIKDKMVLLCDFCTKVKNINTRRLPVYRLPTCFRRNDDAVIND